jgi:hypothetical protein
MRRARADRRHGQAVQLLVRRRRVAGELDAHVAQHAAVVVVVRAAVVELRRVDVRRRAGALDLRGARAVDDAVADDDQAAPVAGLPLADRPLGREHDRRSAVPSAMMREPRSTNSDEPGTSKSPTIFVPGSIVSVALLADLDEAGQHVRRVRVERAVARDVAVSMLKISFGTTTSADGLLAGLRRRPPTAVMRNRYCAPVVRPVASNDVVFDVPAITANGRPPPSAISTSYAGGAGHGIPGHAQRRRRERPGLDVRRARRAASPGSCRHRTPRQQRAGQDEDAASCDDLMSSAPVR